MEKEAQVVMLPTDKVSASIAYSSLIKGYVVSSKLRELEQESGIPTTSFWEYFNLYITTDEEIKEAVALGAQTRQWSMVIQGAEIDLEEFKKEMNQMMKYMSEKAKK